MFALANKIGLLLDIGDIYEPSVNITDIPQFSTEVFSNSIELNDQYWKIRCKWKFFITIIFIQHLVVFYEEVTDSPYPELL